MIATTSPAVEYQRAILAVMGQCDGAYALDGVGFNRYDSPRAREMVHLDPEHWTRDDERAAHAMLRRYRVQLEKLGIAFDALPAPAEPQEAKPPARRVVLEPSGALAVYFPYSPNPDERESFKSTVRSRRPAGGRDTGEPFRWIVPLEAGAVNDLLKWANERNFHIDAEAANAIGSAARGEARAAVAATRSIDYADEQFIVRFGGDMTREQFAKVLDDMRALEGRRWDQGGRFWRVPASEWAGPDLEEFASKWEFTLSAHARQAMESVVELVRTGDAWQERSAAADAHAPELDGFVATNGDTPYPFQRAGIVFARDAETTIIGDEQGLGKTVQALGVGWLTDAFPMVVVCPNTLKGNWATEARKWVPGKSVAILEGTTPRSLARTNLFSSATPDVLIVNYDVLYGWVGALREIQPRLVAFDEAQHIKEFTSRRGKAALELCNGAKPGGYLVPRVLSLTGTPMLNRTEELLPQLVATRRLHLFGASQADFKRKWGEGREVELHTRLRRTGTMIRRLKADVLTELPPLMPVELIGARIDNPEEYERAEEQFLEWVRDQALDNEAYIAKHRRLVEDDAAFMLGLRDLDGHEREARIREELAERRVASASRAAQIAQITALKQVAARGIIRAATSWIRRFIEHDKLVVFAHHVEVQEAIAQAFPGCARLQGGAEGKRRNDADKARFQSDPDCRLIVCSMMAASTGHTLTAACTTVHLEAGWTPADMRQGYARVHRIGQHRTCQPYVFFAENTIYSYVMDLLIEKERLVGAVTDGRPMDGGGDASILPDLMLAMKRLAEEKRAA